MRNQNGGNMLDANYRMGRLNMNNLTNRTAWARQRNGYDYNGENWLKKMEYFDHLKGHYDKFEK